jgi:ribosome biogenesis GTPase
LNLEDFGWNTFFEGHFARHQNNKLIPARVLFQGRGIYRLISEQGELLAEAAGVFRNESPGSENTPICGDWVLADNPMGKDRTMIRLLLPRTTMLSRKQAGTSLGRQLVAANVDTLCLVSGLDSDFNPRRIERYLVIAWESGARPVIILNKADVCPDVCARLAETAALAPGVPVLAVSALDGSGMDCIQQYAGRGKTLALLGSSGVGKSSIANRLLGRSVQIVRDIDPDTGRGMHTTSARHLFLLPSGGLIMDSPGLREIQLWSADTGLDSAFEDIKALAEECRFRDCGHQSEPGCRVRESVNRGELDAGRLASYFKLCKEADYVEQRKTHSANWIEKKRWKKIMKSVRTPKH